MRRTITYIAMLLLSLSTPAHSKEARTIKLGQVSLSFYAVTGGIVQQVLEDEGYAVEIVPGSHADIYPKVGSGEVDILAASWLPNAHAGLYARVKTSVFRLANLYDGAKLYWAVPSYMRSVAVSSVKDLGRQDVLARMDKTIISLPDSTGLTIGARQILTKYGLDKRGYIVEAVHPKKWLDNFKQAVAARRWIVMPLWHPQWINAVYDVRILKEPKGVYGEDNAVLLAHEQLKQKISPATLTRLSQISLSVDAVTEMDRMVNVDGMSPRQAAKRWIKANQSAITNWWPAD